jgi:hypothetical protein
MTEPTTEIDSWGDWIAHHLALTAVSLACLLVGVLFAIGTGFYLGVVAKLFYTGWRLAWGLW